MSSNGTLIEEKLHGSPRYSLSSDRTCSLLRSSEGWSWGHVTAPSTNLSDCEVVLVPRLFPNQTPVVFPPFLSRPVDLRRSARPSWLLTHYLTRLTQIKSMKHAVFIHPYFRCLHFSRVVFWVFPMWLLPSFTRSGVSGQALRLTPFTPSLRRVAGHPLAQNERCLHMFLQDKVLDKNYTPSKIRQAWRQRRICSARSGPDDPKLSSFSQVSFRWWVRQRGHRSLA